MGRRTNGIAGKFFLKFGTGAKYWVRNIFWENFMGRRTNGIAGKFLKIILEVPEINTFFKEIV